MSMVAHFNRLFAYDAWANREVLTSLYAAETPPQRSVEFMAHILSAETLWLQRIMGQQQTLPVWPKIPLRECYLLTAELSAIWMEFVSKIDEGGLSKSVTYKNSQGEDWTSRVEDILQHVIMHSVYHRGQIATEMRAAGLTPASTDFIHAVRQNYIE